MSKLRASIEEATHHFRHNGMSSTDANRLEGELHREFGLGLHTVVVSFGDEVVTSWITDRYISPYSDPRAPDVEAAAWLREKLGIQVQAGGDREWGSDTLRRYASAETVQKCGL
ncbi:hypothetical protein [Agromyces humi]|uniref:hypothetical protein n=1 Tax=Agromyces humi TaxID=1766800 RepID=UPI00135A8AD6|nr:hypothetical protein [Agromyces humi]